MWATHSVVQAVVELVGNPALGVIHKSIAAAYPQPRSSDFSLLPPGIGMIDISGPLSIQ